MKKLILILMLAVFMLGAVPAMADYTPLQLEILKKYNPKAYNQIIAKIKADAAWASFDQGTVTPKPSGTGWNMNAVPVTIVATDPTIIDEFFNPGGTNALMIEVVGRIDVAIGPPVITLEFLANETGVKDVRNALVDENGDPAVVFSVDIAGVYNSETGKYEFGYDDVNTPEPATVVGLGLAAIAVGWRRLRKRLTGR